jgi:hypothetical protein
MQSVAQVGSLVAEGGSFAGGLAKALGERNQKAPMSPMDATTIDIVGMLFEVILDDSEIPGSLRALIAKLQLPYLKLALLDKDFFNNAEHPARRLLNELARAGIGWRESEDPAQDSLYRKVSEIIERTGRDFAEDVGLFQALLEDFLNFSSEERALGEAKEILIGRTKNDVEDVLRQKADKLTLPAMARDFLTGPWKEVLQRIHVRKGAKSEDWAQAVQVMDAFVWSLQPKVDPAAKARLVKLLPQLLKALRSGLDAIGHDAEKSSAFLKALEPLHMLALQGKTPSVAKRAKTADEAAAEAQGNTENDAAAQALAQAKAAVQSLALGSWLEFLREGGKTLRGKLVWRSDILDDFTFVSRTYKVVAERNTATLVAEWAAGKARRLDTVPLLDRALDLVMRRLRGA